MAYQRREEALEAKQSILKPTAFPEVHRMLGTKGESDFGIVGDTGSWCDRDRRRCRIPTHTSARICEPQKRSSRRHSLFEGPVVVQELVPYLTTRLKARKSKAHSGYPLV